MVRVAWSPSTSRYSHAVKPSRSVENEITVIATPILDIFTVWFGRYGQRYAGLSSSCSSGGVVVGGAGWSQTATQNAVNFPIHPHRSVHNYVYLELNLVV